MDMNTFYDLDKNIVGIFRNGVAWSRPQQIRLGIYDEYKKSGYIYNNENEKIAVYDNGVVTDLDGNIVGRYKSNQIYISDKVVGSYIANDYAAAASIALLFVKLQNNS